MNCEQFELRWNELLDLRQRPQTESQLQEHLRHCTECRSLAAAEEAILDAVALLHLPEPSTDLTDKILAQVTAPRPARRWAMLKIAAVLTTAAAITVACWPALFPPEVNVAEPRPMQVESQPVELAATDQAVEDPASAIDVQPIGALAHEASARYQDLARATRDWSNLSHWVPSVSVSLSSNDKTGLSSAAADWMDEVTMGLEPLTGSTSATLQSLLQALPGDASAASSEGRAS